MDDETRFCPACGKARDGDGRYCAGCGRAYGQPPGLDRKTRGYRLLYHSPAAILGRILVRAFIAAGLIWIAGELAASGVFGAGTQEFVDAAVHSDQTCTVWSQQVNVTVELTGPAADAACQRVANAEQGPFQQYVDKVAEAKGLGTSALLALVGVADFSNGQAPTVELQVADEPIQESYPEICTGTLDDGQFTYTVYDSGRHILGTGLCQGLQNSNAPSS